MKTRFGIIRRFHMKKMGIILVIVAISVCLLFMRSNDTNQQPKNSEIAPTKKEGEVDQTKEISTEESIVEDQLAEMSLDEKIGQLIIAGLDGTEVTEQTRTLIDTYHIGGFRSEEHTSELQSRGHIV